ncbi:4941_t:CDS:2 [Paraglomus occultum]|uniref:4941_t:CDS:1 n=1 Tax=Paraglomus occultum TaxID=144539 RepID=A0A9N8YYI9_9GLOM|nr:4941_t:CDS:2 [Paraglomus occultum]
MTMFVPPKNQGIEMWDGSRTGVHGAIDVFGADEAMESAKFNIKVRDIVKNYQDIYIDLPPRTNLLSAENVTKNFNRARGIAFLQSLSWFRKMSDFLDRLALHRYFTGLNDQANEIKPLSRIVQNLRIIKSTSEIKLMRQAGEITGKAFIETMRYTKPGLLEHDLYAKIDFECRTRGAEYLAYVPVVAGGPNALTMHYVSNNMPLRNGDMVLMDAGGEYHGYACDITRTWPVNGKFTGPQRELYEVVLKVNRECIKLCTEKHGISLNGIHDLSLKLMNEELAQLGFRLSEGELDRTLYPHHVGHYLGLDVHDTPDLDRSRKLKKGMVVTIEPGLYVPFKNEYPEQYQGIGIRIEDNVLVGETEPIILSVTAPKEVVDIQYCMANLEGWD